MWLRNHWKTQALGIGNAGVHKGQNWTFQSLRPPSLMLLRGKFISQLRHEKPRQWVRHESTKDGGGAEPSMSEEAQVSIYSMSGDLTPQLKEKSPASSCIPWGHNGELRQVLKDQSWTHPPQWFLRRNLRRQMPREQLLPRLERTGARKTFHTNQGREMICLVTLLKKSICVLKIFRLHDFIEDR